MESQQVVRSSTSYPEVTWDDLGAPGFSFSRETGEH